MILEATPQIFQYMNHHIIPVAFEIKTLKMDVTEFCKQIIAAHGSQSTNFSSHER